MSCLRGAAGHLTVCRCCTRAVVTTAPACGDTRGWQQSGRRRPPPPPPAHLPSTCLQPCCHATSPVLQAVDKAVDSAVANKDKLVAGIGQVGGKHARP